ncbi:hypothetical protein PPL_00851 [Heterostelium album PN500]|uniref:DUF676 domain-containing protein n=1 Tax=Heterostelium pallidum (strain ATCC 26659 / Pp 5 / PN500) TaxID=670386 RepID=D3AYT2_HETP5|nr:hypothetical protein PPL_00851 [Heterostelium album PN500]EFA85622.1 hypothetical protein PPL_00851 [Heterostelium album PN500]|eukprot:XP_020437729.1 hypothetical protein PPL_00851 [Heterostelium album PN500]
MTLQQKQQQQQQQQQQYLHQQHLIFLQHGLHATKSDYDVITKKITEKLDDVVIWSGSTNPNMLTRQGIDKCGERMAQEIMEISKTIKPTHITIIGHSLGGPISRYAIGILHEQGYFNQVIPLQFITLSSPPDCGSRRPKRGLYNVVAGYVTDNLIGTTGRQLMLTDDVDNPLLLEMTKGKFIEGLAQFGSRVLYSTIENDLHVMFNTSNISHSNPYTKPGAVVKLSTKYPHIVDEDATAEFIALSPKDVDIFKNDERGDKLREILLNLQKLTFTRYHMKFDNLLSHTHVIMRREGLNSAGQDVVQHLIEHLILVNKDNDNNNIIDDTTTNTTTTSNPIIVESNNV